MALVTALAGRRIRHATPGHKYLHVLNESHLQYIRTPHRPRNFSVDGMVTNDTAELENCYSSAQLQ